MQAHAERLTEAAQTIMDDHAANAPSADLIYAARDVLAELGAVRRRARAILREPTPVRASEAAVHAARQAAAAEILGEDA